MEKSNLQFFFYNLVKRNQRLRQKKYFSLNPQNDNKDNLNLNSGLSSIENFENKMKENKNSKFFCSEKIIKFKKSKSLNSENNIKFIKNENNFIKNKITIDIENFSKFNKSAIKKNFSSNSLFYNIKLKKKIEQTKSVKMKSFKIDYK